MYVYKARQMFSQRFSEKRRRRTRQLFIIHPSLFSRLFLFISAVTKHKRKQKQNKKHKIISNLHSYYPTGILYLPYQFAQPLYMQQPKRTIIIIKKNVHFIEQTHINIKIEEDIAGETTRKKWKICRRRMRRNIDVAYFSEFETMRKTVETNQT